MNLDEDDGVRSDGEGAHTALGVAYKPVYSQGRPKPSPT